MAAPDRYVYVNDDGKIMMVEENDGWSYMNNQERFECEVTLEHLKDNYGGRHYKAALDQLWEWFIGES